MQEDNRNLAEQVFDILSSIPYLKVTMKALFAFVTLLLILHFLFGYFENSKIIIKKGLTFVLGNFIVAYVFRLWDKRDKEREQELKKNKN